jgi:hypothetical protein
LIKITKAIVVMTGNGGQVKHVLEVATHELLKLGKGEREAFSGI